MSLSPSQHKFNLKRNGHSTAILPRPKSAPPAGHERRRLASERASIFPAFYYLSQPSYGGQKMYANGQYSH